jgi:adenosine/AMP kinase
VPGNHRQAHSVPLGVESEDDVASRRALLRSIGYEL